MFAGDGQAVDVGPADRHRVRAARHGLDDVGAVADAGVEQQCRLRADRLADRHEGVEGADRPVDLAAAVVGHHDRVDTGIERLPGIVGVQNTLEDDRQPRPVPQGRQVVPAQCRVGERVEERLHGSAGLGGAQVLPRRARVVARHLEQRQRRLRGDLDGSGIGIGVRGRTRRGLALDPLGDQLPETRVRGVLRYPDAAGERQRTEVEVPRPPAEGGGVEGDHQRAGVDRLGPGDEAVDQLLVAAPVQLEPAGAVLHRRGRGLHGRGALRGEDVRQSASRGGPADHDVGVATDESGGADRGHQDGRGERLPEHRGGDVAPGGVAEHARHQSPAVECLAVGGHRLPRAGASVDVGPGLLPAGSSQERAAGGGFELFGAGRHRGGDPGDAGAVDDVLARAAEGVCDGGHEVCRHGRERTEAFVARAEEVPPGGSTPRFRRADGP